MQKPIYDAQEEQLLMSRLWSPQLRDDPEKFVLFIFPWGVPGTPLEHMKGPRRWQRRQLRGIAEHIKSNKSKINSNLDPHAPAPEFEILKKAIASGRGIGKSALVAWLVLWMMTTRIGSSTLISANNENQLRTITWGELIKWHAMSINSHWWEVSATKLTPAQWLSTLVERDLKKGTRYWAAEGKLWSEESPDSYAGLHNYDGVLLIFDEASGIPDSIWSVAAGFFTENTPDRYWFAFSNPRRNTGYFFECFNSKRAFWESEQIDARTVENSDKKYYEGIISEYGEDSREARVEVYGEFPAEGEDQFISPQLVDDAFGRPRYNDESAPVIIGVDPARGGADSTVIAVRKGRDIVDIKRHRGDDTMTTVGRVIAAIEQYRPLMVIIDEGGLGYGILDRLKEQNYKCVRGVNFANSSKNPIMWGNKRAEMWGEMKNWLRTASILPDRQLKSDLTSPRSKPNSAGTIFLEGKKEMKARGLASPDAADAIAVTFAFPISRSVMVADNNYSRGLMRSPMIMSSGYSNSWMGS